MSRKLGLHSRGVFDPGAGFAQVSRQSSSTREHAVSVTIWYDFTSSYSYLAVMRIDELASAQGIAVEWQPFLLGPIFQETALGSSPNLISPARINYMWRDIARRAEGRGTPFTVPETFPMKSVPAARAALGLEGAQRGAFTRAVFAIGYGRGVDLGDPEVLREAATVAGLNPDAVLAQTANSDVKAALFAAVDRAKALGIFGAPTFITSDGEMFWGDDRLEDAIAWEADQQAKR